MNKLLGFYELKDSGLPCVNWKTFHPEMKLDSNIMWTVRTAVYDGNDFNLPRKVGVRAKEAYETAIKFHEQLKEHGIVIIYPYFIAQKSGTLEVSNERIVIEAVDKDLWNLVTENKKDVTIIKSTNNYIYQGNKNFLSEYELDLLELQTQKIKRLFRQELASGKSILLEWSFALNTDISMFPIGNPYLIFYECRTI